MKILLLIGTGSFIGGISRYLFTQLLQNKFLSGFPFGTLGVNILGCFIIGLVFGFSEKAILSSEWKLFLATGICGGFTTFSAFSNESIFLFRNGQLFSGLIYITASVVLGLLATYSGLALIKLV